MTFALPHSATFARHLCASTNLAVSFEVVHPEHRLRASSHDPPFTRLCQLAGFDSCAQHSPILSATRHGRKARLIARFPLSIALYTFLGLARPFPRRTVVWRKFSNDGCLILVRFVRRMRFHCTRPKKSAQATLSGHLEIQIIMRGLGWPPCEGIVWHDRRGRPRTRELQVSSSADPC